ncbi:hypothetical protein BpHYR1_001108 [Brachionus plicatilis]|uniref:Uncharacterized protein n=1 Tax=Brachionus plicatilis TaxID=10195 RepID=A0A3M7S843_BRAPC|nr:hypothetical protein BpHYR1_001108 [Brachionus plicatilis]
MTYLTPTDNEIKKFNHICNKVETKDQDPFRTTYMFILNSFSLYVYVFYSYDFLILEATKRSFLRPYTISMVNHTFYKYSLFLFLQYPHPAFLHFEQKFVAL